MLAKDILNRMGETAGASGPVFNVPTISKTRNETSPTDAVCTASFDADGGYSIAGDSVTNGSWIVPSPPGATYYIRWTNLSGTLSSGTAGSWLALTSDRAFGVTYSLLDGSKSCTGLVEIATAPSSGNVVDSGTITLTATVTP